MIYNNYQVQLLPEKELDVIISNMTWLVGKLREELRDKEDQLDVLIDQRRALRMKGK